MAKVHTWLNPILIVVIGFFSVYTLNGVNDRLKNLESKVDRLIRYEVILEQLGSSRRARVELPPFKHEDFITLKTIKDEELETI